MFCPPEGGSGKGLNHRHKAGTMPQYMEIAIPEMLACIVGLAYGYCTVTFRTKYEKMVMPETEEEPEQAKKSA